MSINQRDERRQWTVMIHIRGLKVHITVGCESVPPYLGFPGRWDFCECTVCVPTYQSFCHFPFWISPKDCPCFGEFSGGNSKSYFFSLVCCLGHQHMHCLVSWHVCISGRDNAWVTSSMQWVAFYGHGKKTKVLSMGLYGENWKPCREVTVISVGYTCTCT